MDKKPTTTAPPLTTKPVTTRPPATTGRATARTTKRPPPAEGPRTTLRPVTTPPLTTPKGSQTSAPSARRSTTPRPHYGTTTVRSGQASTAPFPRPTLAPRLRVTATPKPKFATTARPSLRTTPRPPYWTPAPKPTSKPRVPNFTVTKLSEKGQGQDDRVSKQEDRLGSNQVQKPRRRGKKQRKNGRRRSRSGRVRLVGPLSNAEAGDQVQGRVEIFIRGEWGTVCDDLFDSKAAAVVCRQLGFPYALRVARRAEFGAAATDVRILLDDVECEGTERTLLDCRHARVGKNNCSHYEDVGVVCGHSEQ